MLQCFAHIEVPTVDFVSPDSTTLLQSSLASSGGDFCWRLGGHSGRAPKARVSSAVGARIEAPKAPRGVGSGGGAVPPPQKFFRFLSSKRRVLVHSWCYFCS